MVSCKARQGLDITTFRFLILINIKIHKHDHFSCTSFYVHFFSDTFDLVYSKTEHFKNAEEK